MTLVERLGVSTPYIQAGMAGGITTVELVVAVSNHGGLGQIGAGYLTAETLKNDIQSVKRKTNRPFGVNLFVPENIHYDVEDEDRVRSILKPIEQRLGVNSTSLTKGNAFFDQCDVVISEEVPVVSFTFGIPSSEVMKRFKERGTFLIGTATTVEEATLNEEAGMDAIVVQGAEAGGHRGTFATAFDRACVGTMALIPQVADQCKIPLIAAGGIMDGRGTLAAKALGAEMVQLGTQFLLCEESGAHPLHKQAISTAKETDVVLTSAFSGKPARGIHNQFIDTFEDVSPLPYPAQNTLTGPIRKQAGKLGITDYMSMWTGQGVRLAKQETVVELLDRLQREEAKVLEGLHTSKNKRE